MQFELNMGQVEEPFSGMTVDAIVWQGAVYSKEAGKCLVTAAGYLANKKLSDGTLGQKLEMFQQQGCFGWFEGFYWGIANGSVFTYLPANRTARYACNVTRSSAASLRVNLAARRIVIPPHFEGRNPLRAA